MLVSLSILLKDQNVEVKKTSKRLNKQKGRKEMKRLTEVKEKNAITLIALVITIVVLLILARSKYSNTYRR